MTQPDRPPHASRASRASIPPGGTSPRRRVRGYLVDPRFQLKYTGLLVGVVLAVMLALGLVIWRTAETASAHARLATSQAEKAMLESQTSSRITRQNALAQAADSPDLLKMLEEEIAQVDREAEKNLADVKQRGRDIEAQRQRMIGLLVGSGVALVLLLGVMGIFITHRIVGPVFKLKRLLRQVGTSRLGVKERLRRGDELEDLFDTFLQMTYSLTALQRGRLATLDATIRKAEATGAAAEVLDGLRALRAQLCLGLDRVPSAAAAASSPEREAGAR
jgi:nitrogen fixation/metabolism regulation signal transduction histidine kinase